MERLGFLCVLAGALRVAIPLNLVLSVEEAGPLTPLPFSPGLVEGLVMAVGRVLPQMPLSTALGEADRGGGVLVVVAANDDVRALRVDQVAGMVQVDVQGIVSAGAAEHGALPLLTARFPALGAEWQVLDYVRLAAVQPMAPTATAEGATLVAAAGEALDDASAPADTGDEHLPLLVVEIAGESYAVPTAAIVEILVPSVIRSMPGSPAWVAGLLDRRGSPLLVLSTAALLGRPIDTDATITLVVEVPGVGDVGILVDRAIGIERVRRSDIHAVTQDMAGVAEYFVIASECIVGIIDPPALTAQVAGALPSLVPRDAMSSDDAVETVAATRPTRKLLALRVGRDLFALPLDRVERIQASVVLTPLPQPGTGFDAMADVGDTSVPVLDLRQRIAHGGSDPTPPCTLVRIEGALAGLAVDQVLHIEDIPNADVEDIATHPVLPVSHVARAGEHLLSVLIIDRVLPPLADGLDGRLSHATPA